MSEREHIMQELEARGAQLKSSGAVAQWFAGSCPHIRPVLCMACPIAALHGTCFAKFRQLSATVCGPLFEEIAEKISYKNPACGDIFRTGAVVPLQGTLTPSLS